MKHQSQSLSEISRRTGLPLATVHRLLGEMERWGALNRGEDGRYRIGLRLWEIGSLTSARVLLRSVAIPFLQTLSEVTRKDVYLAVADGVDAVFVEYLSTQQHGRGGSRVCGSRHRLDTSAAGLALLANDSDLASTVLSKLAANPAASVFRQLAQVRRLGYALLSERPVPNGAYSIAVPAVWEADSLSAAIGLTAPDLPSTRRWLPELTATARGVQRALSTRAHRLAR